MLRPPSAPPLEKQESLSTCWKKISSQLYWVAVFSKVIQKCISRVQKHLILLDLATSFTLWWSLPSQNNKLCESDSCRSVLYHNIIYKGIKLGITPILENNVKCSPYLEKIFKRSYVAFIIRK